MSKNRPKSGRASRNEVRACAWCANRCIAGSKEAMLCINRRHGKFRGKK